MDGFLLEGETVGIHSVVMLTCAALTPRHFAEYGKHQKKNVPCFPVLRASKFFELWKGHFSFGVLPSKYSGRWRG